MGQFGVGQAVRRTEDARLLTGGGRFLDDIELEGQTHAVFLRSPHAHAALRAIDVSAAAAAPGVLAVYTGADAKTAGLGDLPCVVTAMGFKMERLDGQPAYTPVRHVLARDHVHHVGDPIAMVVAETVAAAKDAVELISVEFEALPASTGTSTAIDAASPRVHSEAPDNLAFDAAIGDAEKTADAFARADHVAEIDLVQNRVVVSSMEARGAIGDYDADTGRYTLICGLQTVYRIRQLIAQMLGIPEDELRVISPDVGGAFGMKGFTYPEQPLVLWAAKQLGRPVKWKSERSEAFLCDNQGRDLVTHGELALDKDGHFLGLRVNTTSTVGAYFSNFAPMIVSLGNTRMLSGVYALPALHAQVKVGMSNTVPVDAYRGAGRPEACYAMERLVDVAANDLGLAPEEIRRRNLVAPEQMPFTGPTGVTFDSGDFAQNLTDCLKLSDWDAFPGRKAASAQAGMLRGIGLSNYVEATAAAGPERSAFKFGAGGSVQILVGSQSSGQGHFTAFAQLAADKLGVPFDSVEILQGDSDRLPDGGGTGGSRSVYSGGGAILDGVEKIMAKGIRIAAHMFEAAEADVEFVEGAFAVKGTDRTITMFDLAQAAKDPANLPAGVEPGLDEAGSYKPAAASFPNGCHVCEVEVDPETGVTKIVRYSVVDDFGTVLNPMIVAGQVHGGIAQGIGQALVEHCIYDDDSGQLLSGSFMDYALPRADDMPSFDLETNEVPCLSNSLGAKGAGEAGTTGSLGAVINAIVDALAEFGVTHIDMPATPERVWQTIQKARPSR